MLAELHKAWRRRDVNEGLLLTREYPVSLPIATTISKPQTVRSYIHLPLSSVYANPSTDVMEDKSEKGMSAGVSYHSVIFGVLLSQWGFRLVICPNADRREATDSEILFWFWGTMLLTCRMLVVEETTPLARQHRNAAVACPLAGIPLWKTVLSSR